MRSWKKRWQDELDAVVPALSEEVKNTSIPLLENVKADTLKESVSQRKTWYTEILSTPRRLAACISACAIALTAVGVSAYFTLRPEESLAVSAEELISVEVNPQAVFSVGEDGKVTAVISANNDADIVLSENRDREMEGKTVEEAVKIFVDYAAQLGYLDLENSDAVRITSCTENGKLEEVGDTLEHYFREMGAYVAVAEETVEINTFCSRVGFFEDSLTKLKEDIEQIPALSFEREVEGKTDEALKEIYRENVSLKEIKSLLDSSILNGVEKIKSLEEISVLSEKIIRIGKLDYWTLSSLNRTNEALQELMAEMANKLSAYEQTYGIKMESLVDLAKEAAKCSATALQFLTEALTEYSLEFFKENFTAIVEVLETLGVDTSKLTEFYELPETAEEYMQKLEEYAKTCYENLRKENLDVYESNRDKISEENYKRYLENLIAEYGSLSEYFEKN